MMKRPSNVVLAFTMTIASSLSIWIGYLIIFQATQSIAPQIDKIYESQSAKIREIVAKSWSK